MNDIFEQMLSQYQIVTDKDRQNACFGFSQLEIAC